MNLKIYTHDPQTGELRPVSEEAVQRFYRRRAAARARGAFDASHDWWEGYAVAWYEDLAQSLQALAAQASDHEDEQRWYPSARPLATAE